MWTVKIYVKKSIYIFSNYSERTITSPNFYRITYYFYNNYRNTHQLSLQ